MQLTHLIGLNNLKRLPINWHSPYTISGLLHLVILIILLLIYIRPAQLPVWHTFEWEQPQTEEPVKTPSQTTDPVPEAKKEEVTSTQTITEENTPESPAIYDSPKPAPATDYIEPPKIKQEQAKKGSEAPITPSLLGPRLSIPKGRPAPSGSGGGTYDVTHSSGIFFDENYRVAPKIKDMEFARITLTFRLASDGRVDPESITAKEVTNLSYLAATKEALSKWKVKTRFDPNQIYEITFIFNPS